MVESATKYLPGSTNNQGLLRILEDFLPLKILPISEPTFLISSDFSGGR